MDETATSEDISDEFFLEDIDGDAVGAAVHEFCGFAAEQESGREGGAEDEEEELEWLANKDAFPAVETSFDPATQSWSNGSTVASSAGDRLSPVSVLTTALPFRAPARSRSKGNRRRRKALSCFAAIAGGPPPSSSVLEVSPARGLRTEKRKCLHCAAEETPQWRAGPEGPKTLCNACGVRFKSGRLVPEYRPASSPTFSPAIHSNCHRKVVEMRRQKYGSDGPGGRGTRSVWRPPPPPPPPALGNC